MAKIREELVGKRFLCVTSGAKLKLSKINEWDWRAGVIRACTHTDAKHPDLQVLVEYDDVSWQRREWVHVYRDKVFQIFLLERTLSWAPRKHPVKHRTQSILWPALIYFPLVDFVGISNHKYRPVEYLVDHGLDYHDYGQIQNYRDGDERSGCVSEAVGPVRCWVGEQDGQRILLTTPSVLVGFRVQVYRAEGTTQWYTAVIVGYNDATRELTVTDDTVLEEHSEDPSLVQIRLIGEGVVESILRGENVGITPRRSRAATNNHHQTGVRHIRRDHVSTSAKRKNSLSKKQAQQAQNLPTPADSSDQQQQQEDEEEDQQEPAGASTTTTTSSSSSSPRQQTLSDQEPSTSKDSAQEDQQEEPKDPLDNTGARDVTSGSSEASSGDDDSRPLRGTRLQQSEKKKVLALLEKQTLNEDSNSSSSSSRNSTPDHRPQRRTPRKTRVQSSSSEATEAELPTSSSISSSSSSSSSNSSSSTPEPEQLPTRPPARRAAVAAAALRKKVFKTCQRGGKVKNNGQIRGRGRHKRRWRSVSPPTSLVSSPASSDATPPTHLSVSSTPTNSDTVPTTTPDSLNVTSDTDEEQQKKENIKSSDIQDLNIKRLTRVHINKELSPSKNHIILQGKDTTIESPTVVLKRISTESHVIKGKVLCNNDNSNKKTTLPIKRRVGRPLKRIQVKANSLEEKKDCTTLKISKESIRIKAEVPKEDKDCTSIKISKESICIKTEVPNESISSPQTPKSNSSPQTPKSISSPQTPKKEFCKVEDSKKPSIESLKKNIDDYSLKTEPKSPKPTSPEPIIKNPTKASEKQSSENNIDKLNTVSKSTCSKVNSAAPPGDIGIKSEIPIKSQSPEPKIPILLSESSTKSPEILTETEKSSTTDKKNTISERVSVSPQASSLLQTEDPPTSPQRSPLNKESNSTTNSNSSSRSRSNSSSSSSSSSKISVVCTASTTTSTTTTTTTATTVSTTSTTSAFDRLLNECPKNISVPKKSYICSVKKDDLPNDVVEASSCDKVVSNSSVSDTITTNTSVSCAHSVDKSVKVAPTSVIRTTGDDTVNSDSQDYIIFAGSKEGKCGVNKSDEKVSSDLTSDNKGKQSPVSDDSDEITCVSIVPAPNTSRNSATWGVSNTVGGSSAYSGRGCVGVDPGSVVSGRAVTITATSGPGPATSGRVASPPSVSITAVVRNPSAPSHPQASPPAPAPKPSAATLPHPHHDGATHASPHHQQQHHNPSQQQQHQQQHQREGGLCVGGSGSSSRMDACDGSSDSGVSVTERSVSRSSVLSDDRSSSAEVKPNTPTPTLPTLPAHAAKPPQTTPLYLDRKEHVRVWRDPSLVHQSEHSVRHIHSVQHSMSQHYPGVPPPHHAAPPPVPVSAPSSHGPGGHPPSHHPAVSHALPPGLNYSSQHAAAVAAAAAGVPPHLAPPDLQPPLAAGLYPPLSHEVWRQLGGPVPHLNPHAAYNILRQHQQEELLLQERAIQERRDQERLIRERREVEAREKERAAKEKMERERVERERREREREDRIRQDQERQRREMEEKHRQKSQVDEHFDRSIRLAQQKHGGGEGGGHHHYLMQQSQLPVNHLPNANTHNHSHHRNTHHHHQQQQQQHHQTKASSYQTQAQPQKAAGGWNQIPMVKPGDERLLDHRIAEQRRHEDSLRRAVEPVKMVQDSIYKAFRTTEQDSKSHYPPPAHSSKPPDKAAVSALPKLADPSFNLSSNYYHKDPKMASHPSERVPYGHYDHREKNSVIIKPDTAPPHSSSPKQRPHERSSPYAPSSAYKAHEPAPAPHRSSLPLHHSPHSQSPHSVELSKARQPQISPHSVPSPAHGERAYYPPVAKPPPTTFASPSFNITAGLVPNPMHVSAMPPKSKVSSPPLQVYGKPGITSGTPVCRVDTRVSQPPLPLTTKPSGGGPPPAHSGPSANRGHPEPRSLNPHEQRSPYERVPYDGRSYPPTVPSPHHKHVVAPGPPPPTQARLTPVSSPHVVTAHIPSPGPTQTQPLDLGTRDDTASPHKRRTHTPTPQDTKKPRYESVPSSQQPTLSRVSEPSPLYPTAATTITTVENTVALANLSQRVASPVQRVASPLSRPPSHPPAAGTPTLQQHPDRTQSPSLLKQTPQQLQQQIQQKKEDQQQPPLNEPDKSNSPGPPGGYIHKLKKAWLQRHETVSDTQTPPTGTSVNTNQSNNSSNNSTTNNSPQLSPQPTTTSTINPSKVNTTTTITDSKSDKNQPRKNLVNSLTNGHSQGNRSIKDEDSDSMSDSDDNSSKSSGKRKSHKRKKQQRRKGSDSNSDSDKDSDTSASSGKKSERASSKDEPKKRGRKPKSKTEIKIEDGPKPKKSKEEPPQNDPLQKPPIAHLKKTGESFLQDGSCYEVAPKLPKCRECRWTAHQRNKRNNIFCRFYAFRRLRYTKNGQLAVAGFSDPVKDASKEDTALWTPNMENPPSDLDVETSKFLISHVGDQFCDLVQSEKEAMAMQAPEDIVMAWKRVVQGVREMCDVCETTLFNVHWACSKCGFVVCIDCYKGRKNGTSKTVEDGPKDRDEFLWLLCASRVAHEQDKLMLTQIISGNALLNLGKKVHEVRHNWGIPQLCECPEAKKYKEETTDDKKKVNGLNKDLLKTVKKEVKPEIVNGVVKTEKENVNGKDDEMSNSPLNFFADVALSNDKRDESSDSDSDSSSDEKGNFSTLRELLIRPNAKSNGNAKDGDSGGAKPTKDGGKKKAKVDSLDDVISCVIETNVERDEKKSDNDMVLKHFVRKYNYIRHGREPLPIRIMTKVESSTLYPKVPHSWLCDGKLLRLLDPVNPNNKEMFQDMWKRGQPVIISGVGHKLNQDIWKPSTFSKDFGEIKNDLINCLTGNIVPNQPMKKFWDGFDHYSKRLKDEKGQPMVLKLKDWPPTDDFAEMLPSRFEDLMKKLPMPQYTLRNGVLNLAGRLPDSFVRPDLGPKMYIAYGSSLHPNKASTNLHLDISDAANVMCYVGVPKDSDYAENIKEAYKAIDAAGCDILTRRRVREKDEIPGALWHIYHARDSDKIRDFLNKVSIERGDRLEPHHDPIHDQSWYLDGPLRDRLYKDYGVEGYAIVQCYGDAMFIPAGAPHQVRNLHNCVKVAEDFVSPENVSHCFHLTQEFRALSDTHTNHEDKLQIKNIIYHQMKDALTVLMAESKKKIDVKEEGSPKEKIEIKTESDS